MNRKALALLALVALLATSGCLRFFTGGPVQRSDLAENGTYEWDASADGYLKLHESNYTAVYGVSNRTTGTRKGNYSIEVFTRDTLGTEQPLEISAVQFRYENGTVLRYAERNGSIGVVAEHADGTTEPAPGALAVDTTRSRTVIYLPANESGKLAYTAPKNGKQVSTPQFVSGSYEMVLPENGQVGLPILAQVQPNADRTEVDEAGRVHIHWSGLEGGERQPLIVRFYLERDLLIFASILVGLTATGIVGAIYYALEIRKTRKKREEVGLDVDTGDDDGKRPPPGMR